MSPRGRPTLSSESPDADADTNRFFEDVSCCVTMTEGGLSERVLAETLLGLGQWGSRRRPKENNAILR